ncbi:MAG: ABC transporter permease [candidate division Zixibacteria bacterium]
MNMHHSNPPRLPMRILQFFARFEDFRFIAGDFEEMYQSIARRQSIRSAKFWLYLELICSIPGFIKTSIYWSVIMFRSYLIVAFRNIRKYKGYTFINVAGLAIGLACCMLISLWILNAMSFDKFYPEVNQIHRVMVENANSTPNLLGPALQDEIAEVQYATRIEWTHSALLKSEDHMAYEWCLAADSTFFDIFGYRFLVGDSKTALQTPNSIVLAKDVAEKYFPKQDAIGQSLSWNNNRIFTVTGVIENVPQNSILQFDMVVSIDNITLYFKERGMDYMSWDWWSASTYVKVWDGVTTQQLNDKLSNFLIPDGNEVINFYSINIANLYRHLTDIDGYIAVFSAVAIIILIMACINFINLTTARTGTRAKETGIRKVVGAYRSSLIFQYFGESFILTFSSLLIALGILYLALPALNSIHVFNLSLDMLYSSQMIIIMIVTTILTAILAGLYPAMVLSGFKPVAVLKNDFKTGRWGSLLRKSLVVTQFFLSIVLIIGTIIVYSQVDYFKSKDAGYNKEHVVNIILRSGNRENYELLKSELAKDPSILAVTGSTVGMPYWRWTTGAANWEGKLESDVEVAVNKIDFNFIKTFQIEITEGRDFSRDITSDSKSAYLINQKMADLMGLDPIIGTNLSMWGDEGKIIGVIEDFHFRPLQTTIQPLVLLLRPNDVNILYTRIQSGNIPASIDFIKTTWEKINPDYPFEYQFLDQQFNVSYRSIERIGKLIGIFSSLAIFIGCLGLFGLASFTAEQRTKEIGIRKVLGASVAGIVQMISREFVVLVTIANVLAWPLAWYVMNLWLEDFAYRVEITWMVFLLVGGFSLIIALLTVSYQAIRAAHANPVDAIKCE